MLGIGKESLITVLIISIKLLLLKAWGQLHRGLAVLMDGPYP